MIDSYILDLRQKTTVEYTEVNFCEAKNEFANSRGFSELLHF